jgi:hydroxymethylpyrimidine pyrophosphatase-like HAD family hydrolase
MRYQLVAIDLDGTLLDSDKRVSPKNAQAIERAIRSGVRVVPCTGRAWHESRSVLRSAPMPPLPTGVFVNGATIRDLSLDRPLEAEDLDGALLSRLVVELAELPEALLLLQDRDRCGYDYLITGAGRLHESTYTWFERTGALVRHRRAPGPADLACTLRLSLIAPLNRVRALAEAIRARFAKRFLLHHFEVLAEPEPERSLHLMEVLGPGVDKWRGIDQLAQQWGIPSQSVAVIGDEINDLPMMLNAGCPIAMANAIPQVKQAARYHTSSNDESGVAYALERLIEQDWT